MSTDAASCVQTQEMMTCGCPFRYGDPYLALNMSFGNEMRLHFVTKKFEKKIPISCFGYGLGHLGLL